MQAAGERLFTRRFEVSIIAAAQVKGGLEEEIQIDVDQGKLAAMDISLQRIADVVQSSNINLPGGALRDLDTQYLVRTLNEYEDIEQIGALIISLEPNGAPVYLRDVAVIKRGHKDRTEIARVNGQECVELAIFKEGDSNTVEVAKGLRTKLEELRRDLPEGHKLVVLFDQSGFIEQSIADVRTAALVGGVLAFLVLLVFLWGDLGILPSHLLVDTFGDLTEILAPVSFNQWFFIILRIGLACQLHIIISGHTIGKLLLAMN